MRSLGLLTFLICLGLLVGCSSARPQAPQGAPLAAAPAVQPMAAPPTGAAPGERVIKVIQLPKGQTPYDLPDA
jgi:hypothetical protein